MANFDLSKYETVKSRKERFYKDHEDGAIIVDLVTEGLEIMEYALFKATIYFTKEDQEKGIPRATGYAMEVRDKEKKISNYGKEYESVNFSSWTENAEESAVGRALDNAGYSGNKKASREEMEKAQRQSETLKKQIPTPPVKGVPNKAPIENDAKCSDCNQPISETVLKYSMDVHKQPLCYNCQEKLTKKK